MLKYRSFPKNNNHINVGITLFVILVLTLIVTLIWQKSKPTPVSREAELIPTTSNEQDSVIAEEVLKSNNERKINIDDLPIVPEGWQRYVNEELGFSVNYPEGWFVKDYQARNYYADTANAFIGFDPFQAYPRGPEWMVYRYEIKDNSREKLDLLISQDVKNYHPSQVTISQVEFNDYSAVKVNKKKYDNDVISISLYIIYNNYIYSIRTGDYSQVTTDIEIEENVEGATSYKNRLILFKELSEKKYHDLFLESFRIIE